MERHTNPEWQPHHGRAGRATDATVRAAFAHEYDARQRRTQKSNAGRADVGPAGGKEAIALRQRGRQLGSAIGRPEHWSGAHSGAALHTQQQQRRPSTFGPLLVSLPLCLFGTMTSLFSLVKCVERR